MSNDTSENNFLDESFLDELTPSQGLDTCNFDETSADDSSPSDTTADPPAAKKKRSRRAKKWQGAKPPVVTDARGKAVRPIGPKTVDKALDQLVSPTVESKRKPDYAMLWCEGLGIGLMRWGRKPEAARYCVSRLDGQEDVWEGLEGRERAVEEFLALWKEKRVYGPPEGHNDHIQQKD